jgi:drug/metabolite transporter (DMT)-like permease
VGKIFVGQHVLPMEASGAIVAFSGAVLCSKDSSEASMNPSLAIWGDCLAILAALGGVGYLVFAQTTRLHMTLFVFMWLTMALGSFMILLFGVIILHEDVTWGMDRETGIWGFFRLEYDRLPLEFFVVIVCNVMGTMGKYIRND